MIILDASAVVDLLIKPAADTEVLRARIRASSTVDAPHPADRLRRDQCGHGRGDRGDPAHPGRRLARAAGHRAGVELV
jgi:hypothetical protein